jgi:Mn-dependent DtxR family transcriptional regulator
MHSYAEENYLKEIFKLSETKDKAIATNAIAAKLDTSAASVTDMLKKLASKKLIHYTKYQGVYLSNKGRKVAIEIIRKHRLWEVFLVEKLKFKWDEVHEMAEQLEHINSKEMVDRLDKYLGYHVCTGLHEGEYKPTKADKLKGLAIHLFKPRDFINREPTIDCQNFSSNKTRFS